ncbi:hypothetical protein E2C01_006094 [Portunus trituberculatus]|uniref:Uncharacterized protein n=1 Tax=Portunus trituberculatus TaxID=210409 RepID=A0A5B7D0V7_PORTR|nr:hypothetical protein [Portunus trituberculatus]
MGEEWRLATPGCTEEMGVYGALGAKESEDSLILQGSVEAVKESLIASEYWLDFITHIKAVNDCACPLHVESVEIPCFRDPQVFK